MTLLEGVSEQTKMHDENLMVSRSLMPMWWVVTKQRMGIPSGWMQLASPSSLKDKQSDLGTTPKIGQFAP
jgi:hypothetical protein